MSIHTIEHCRIADETEKIAYEHGAEDMREAICTLYSANDDVLSRSTIKEMFSTIHIRKIVEDTVAMDIITKIKHWKEIKKSAEGSDDLDFKIGDEVKCVHPIVMNYGMKYIVLKTGDEMKLLDPMTFSVYYSDNFEYYNKTGKHYDSIPIPKGENK